MSADEQRKLAAIMFTDMVGYSALSQRDEKLAQDLLEEHRRLLREIFPRFNGTEIKTIGDAFLVEFNSALEAAQCAIEIQRAIAHRNHDVPAERRIDLKIGVHIGDVVHRGGDVYGDGVNIASRIEPLAGPGGVCISMDVERQIRNALEARFEKLAPTDLKNISVPMELFRIVLPWEQQPTKAEGGRKKDEAGKRSAMPWHEILLAVLLIAGLIAAGVFFFRSRPAPKTNAVTSAAPAASSVSEKSIAVLPFENLSEDKSNAYFADGVQDEILTNLARVAALKVISRTSVMQYRDRAARNLREIGQQLGVAHVLEGSVQRAAGKIRVNAQLIDARSDAHLWAQTYDRDLADVFAIQSEIARTIAEQLQAKLSPKEEAVIDAKPTKDLVAYDLYLKAAELDRNLVTVFGSGGAEVTKQGIQFLEEAVRRDPAFVSALCRLAGRYLYLHWINDRSAPYLELAKKTLEAAARLQPDAGEVHLTRGLLYYRGFLDYELALAELNLARRSLPNEAFVPHMTAMVERRRGRWEDAIRHSQEALALDPRNSPFISELATTYLILHRYEEAATTLDNAFALEPRHFGMALIRAIVDFDWKADLTRWRAVVSGQAGPPAAPNDLISARLILALAERNYRAAQAAIDTPGLAELDDNGFFQPREWLEGIVARGVGDSARAEAAFTAARQRVAAALQQNPADARTLMVLGQIDAALGRKEDAVREGKQAVALLPTSRDLINGGLMLRRLARIYAQTGDTDRAINFIQDAINIPNGLSYGILKLEEDWDPLRSDPRFQQTVASLAPKEPKT
jgi:TolB-like protein/class 3 adenylate cyclase/Flp pilus assembly protein TadD